MIYFNKLKTQKDMSSIFSEFKSLYYDDLVRSDKRIV